MTGTTPRQMLVYVVVGGLTFLVFLAANAALTRFLSFPPPAATGGGLVVSGLFNFIAHRRVTFRSTRPVSASFVRYALLLGFTSLTGALIVAVATGWLGLGVVAANALSLLVVTGLSYVLMARLVM